MGYQKSPTWGMAGLPNTCLLYRFSTTFVVALLRYGTHIKNVSRTVSRSVSPVLGRAQIAHTGQGHVFLRCMCATTVTSAFVSFVRRSHVCHRTYSFVASSQQILYPFATRRAQRCSSTARCCRGAATRPIAVMTDRGAIFVSLLNRFSYSGGEDLRG